jgi:transcription antitermination factor NusG
LEDHRWYVIASEHRQERLAAQSIREIGFQAFLPLIRLRIPATPKRAAMSPTMPAFPGYLFALWADGDPWHRIKAARGCASILSVVGRTEQPATVPTPFMDTLLRRASAVGVLEDLSAPDLLPSIQAGSWVRITKGPLSGRLALCEWSTEERVSLLLEVLGGSRSTRMRRDFVEPTEDPL